MVYEQNLDVERNSLRPGDEVWLEWDAGHAFGVPVDEAAEVAAAVEEPAEAGPVQPAATS
jgi:spermidine/putrescine transport system ATP-binding protein